MPVAWVMFRNVETMNNFLVQTNITQAAANYLRHLVRQIEARDLLFQNQCQILKINACSLSYVQKRWKAWKSDVKVEGSALTEQRQTALKKIIPKNKMTVVIYLNFRSRKMEYELSYAFENWGKVTQKNSLPYICGEGSKVSCCTHRGRYGRVLCTIILFFTLSSLPRVLRKPETRTKPSRSSQTTTTHHSAATARDLGE